MTTATEPTAPASSSSSPASGPAASTSGSNNHSSSSSSGGKRSWGAWGMNRRIKDAKVSLLKNADAGATAEVPSQQQQQQQPSSNSSSQTSAAAVAAGEEEETVAEIPPGDDAVIPEDGVKIFSRKLGKKRPKKEAVDPFERQALVKDALRVAAQQMAGGPDAEADSSSSNCSSSSSSRSGRGQQWWQDKYQAVYLPSIRWVAGGQCGAYCGEYGVAAGAIYDMCRTNGLLLGICHTVPVDMVACETCYPAHQDMWKTYNLPRRTWDTADN